MAAAAVGVFAAYLDATSAPQRSWVVATRDISVGTALTERHFTTVPLDLPPELEGRVFADVASLVGAIATAPLARHDLVSASHVVEGGAGAALEHLSFAVDRSRAVGGALVPGDRIDVLASYGEDYTEAVVRDVVVVRAGDADAGLSASGQLVLTVAVTSGRDALAVAHAVNNAQLVLVRATGREDEAGGPARFAPGDSADGADAGSGP